MDQLNSKRVMPRKEHLCHGCRKIQPSGIEILRETYADGGDIYTIYMCDECIRWCEEKKCRDCMKYQDAYEGYVRECRIDHHEEA